MFYLLFAFFLLSSFRSFMAAREEQEFLNLFYQGQIAYNKAIFKRRAFCVGKRKNTNLYLTLREIEDSRKLLRVLRDAGILDRDTAGKAKVDRDECGHITIYAKGSKRALARLSYKADFYDHYRDLPYGL